MQSFYVSMFLFLMNSYFADAQKLALSFQEAEKKGISMQRLDSLYTDAINASDANKGVFKTPEEMKKMQESYRELLQSLADYLAENDFTWDRPQRCFNRVYFNTEGEIDYFLFNFLGKTKDKPSKDKQLEFNQLLNRFIQGYTFPIQSNRKFAQCSPTTYLPK